MMGISRDLEGLSFKGLVNLTTAMLGVHRYAYNGLGDGISPFHSRSEAIISIKGLMTAEIDIISSMDIGNEERELLEKIKKELNSVGDL
ncbi:hypothetical protein IC006_2447 [Sulfuracidifex tepidarius]|uniref:Uncharacterized protein n=2 Tax=Sulfuracidifex tepidarius TaxID=1294262 RepID=A0A510DY03_9CREN|nr:hypothetical protein [Sulfuracidifex tepidarius]BBG25112.1 hypothetical protein IC006_2447 [Sulfuracidifex tepidarius]BBG27894.1 hypothetical protein IC007_2449 [Sulfuracidifex tepidarius]